LCHFVWAHAARLAELDPLPFLHRVVLHPAPAETDAREVTELGIEVGPTVPRAMHDLMDLFGAPRSTLD
jgi:hypothetical protein